MNKLLLENCTICGGRLDHEHGMYCPYCQIVFSSTCPECNSYTWEHNDPAKDTSMGVYCSNKDCPYTENQHMTWEDDIKQDFICEFCGKLKSSHGVCFHCPEEDEEQEVLETCGCCGEIVPQEYMHEGMCSYCFRVNVGE